jgi:hypothetical protein
MTDKDPPDSFEEQLPESDRKSLIKRVLAAGADAPKVVLDSAVRINGTWAKNYARKIGADPSDQGREQLVNRVIRAHVILARSEGAAAALAITGLEVTSFVGSAGTLTPGAAITGLAGDLVGLAWIQVRMLLVIAALYGHDPTDGTRYREVLILMGVYGPVQADKAAKLIGKRSERIMTRLILRHLKGERLKAVKALLHLGGVNFTRTGLIKVTPFVNVPVAAFINSRATAALGHKAREYYEVLPASD